MKLTRNIALVVALCVFLAFIALLSVPHTSWPLWAQGALAVAILVALPLLNALGVLEALGLNNMPGSRFNARHMFTGTAFFAAAFFWVIVLVRLVPDTNLGMAVLVVPALIALVTATFFFLKGTLWR